LSGFAVVFLQADASIGRKKTAGKPPKSDKQILSFQQK